MIAKTYDLQKTELAETRRLLTVSTDAQEKQIKLAALTALLNSNLMVVNVLQIEKASLLREFITSDDDEKLILRFNELEYIGKHPESFEYDGAYDEYKDLMQEIREKKGEYHFSIIQKASRTDEEIKLLMGKNDQLKIKIESFLK